MIRRRWPRGSAWLGRKSIAICTRSADGRASPRISTPHGDLGPWISLEPTRNTMIVEAQVTISGSRAAIWAAITNIENASEFISGIKSIEVVEKPANGLVGLKWRETRMLFGK